MKKCFQKKKRKKNEERKKKLQEIVTARTQLVLEHLSRS